MIPAWLADAVTLAALVCLAVALVRDLAEELRARVAPGPGMHPGLGLYRAGVLCLWLALALRLEAGAAAHGSAAPWLGFACALAGTVPLHLLHVQGWKGAPSRRAAMVAAALVLATAMLGWVRSG